MCPSICSIFRNLQHNQQANAHIIHSRHNWEGCSLLSIKCTPPTLVSISSPPLSLSAKLCSICVHWSVQDLEIYHIISRPLPIAYSTGIIGRAVVCCPSNAHPQLWCLSAPLHRLCLLNFVPWECIDPFKSFIFTPCSAGISRYQAIEAYLAGRSRLSVACTLPTLVSISSPPSPLPDKLCSMSVHTSIQDLEFCRLISRQCPYYTIETYMRGS